jgi:hypothetical protein
VLDLILLPLALATGTVVLVLARARALARPVPGGLEADAPLAEPELRRLRRWERRLRRAVVLVGVAYFAVLASWWAGADDGSGEPTTSLLLLGITCVLGAAIQFSERCPRCGYNLGFQVRLLLPERCERCGGAYR